MRTRDIWFISDLHLFHANMLRGGKIAIRPFDTLAQMHDAIVTGWNSVVKPQDKVYMQGDLTLIRDRNANGVIRAGHRMEDVWNIVRRLQGIKRILLGNHDHASVEEYKAMGFEKVAAYREMNGICFSHIPIHPSQFYRFKGNVHGHTHASIIRQGPDVQPPDTRWRADERYINVCVEPRNYVPIHLETCIAHFNETV